MNRPFMKLFVGDYLLDTRDLDAEQHGIYLLLLMLAWRRPNGLLPNDYNWMRSNLPPMHGLTFKRLVPPLLVRFFVLTDSDCWQNRRLEKELRKFEERSEKQKQNADKRWAATSKHNDLSDATAMPPDSDSESERKKPPTPLAGGAPRKTRNKPREPLPDDFLLTAARRQHGIDEGLSADQVEETFAEFRRYWYADGRSKNNWEAEWGNRARKVAQLQRDRAKPLQKKIFAWDEDGRQVTSYGDDGLPRYD